MRRPNPFDDSDNYNTFYDHPYYSQGYPRKQQRREAATIAVDSVSMNNNNSDSDTVTTTNRKRKSVAQPRPVLTVPPKGIGPIDEPNRNDVLCGRGGLISSHDGNVQFRKIVNSRKKEYLAPTTKKLEKAFIAAAIVNEIRTMGGRFLKQENGTGMWYDIGDAKAIKKAGQALREDAPSIRPVMNDIGDTKIIKKAGQELREDAPSMRPVMNVTPSPRSVTKESNNPRGRFLKDGNGTGSWNDFGYAKTMEPIRYTLGGEDLLDIRPKMNRSYNPNRSRSSITWY